VVLEGAFITEFARPAIQDILKETGAQYLELFCHVHDEIRQERFSTRVDKGIRHPAHLDKENMESPRPSEPYSSLGLGDIVSIDTAQPFEEQLTAACNGIRSRLS
jgi:hypothetical protein